jgi:hypothetical protein
MPEVYFALADGSGRTEWLFCDGSRVVSEGGKPPEYVAPPDGHAAPKSQHPSFVRAALKYRQSQIRRPPRATP